MTKNKNPKLLVVFDTSVLYTQVASDLFRADVQRLIKENSNHNDLDIEWYLPDTVIGERRYQMIQKAKELLPNMGKLEKLLGHKFGVGENTLELHVDNAIAKGVNDCEIKKIILDTNKVNWEDVVSRSICREPPFEANEKEKGFRDSVIANCFLQLQSVSPSTPNICRLAFVSNDQLLRDYAKELTISSKNVRILASLDELESLINTLVSTIPEELVLELSKKAGELFFVKGSEKTLFYKENIQLQIKDQYSSVLNDPILENHLRGSGTWWISEPIFIRKARSRIHWVSNVEPEIEVYHYEHEKPAKNAMLEALGGLVTEPTNQTSAYKNSLALSALGSQYPNDNLSSTREGLGLLGSLTPSKKVVDLSGREKFEIHWSTNLTQAKNLTSPKLEKIEYLGNDIS